MAVLVVQTRETDASKLALLADRLQEKIHAEFGIQCLIELVVPHTLPRTSSGKLSRSSARKEFVERRRNDADESPTCFISGETSSRSCHRERLPSGSRPPVTARPARSRRPAFGTVVDDGEAIRPTGSSRPIPLR
jgi:hypothetical protein